MKTLVASSLIATLILSGSLHAFGMFDIDIDKKIQRNANLIKEYESRIKQLEERNKYLRDEKAKNPALYVKKPLYEDLKDKYIHRIKLNGAQTDKINFMIKDDVVSLNMNMKNEEKSQDAYFYNSFYFSRSFSIPNDVAQDKISHKIDGDYFEIIMPKK
ncbi:MAG: Hsp20/alpha crystallin family protein [Helicobacteraceae bacterium]|nr:Hsp20/alpha crystallin family protein [Candidatus Sulfurimonas ponti]